MFLKTPAFQSSFSSIEKDLGLIVQKMLGNDTLKKLLFYNTKDCLNKENLDDKQSMELIENNIRIVPRVQVENFAQNYIFVRFDEFYPSGNPQFRDNTIEFTILCPYDQWNLGDFRMRPYKIAEEIDRMFNNQHLTGIGTLNFAGATDVYAGDLGGICMLYNAVHKDDSSEQDPSGY